MSLNLPEVTLPVAAKLSADAFMASVRTMTEAMTLNIRSGLQAAFGGAAIGTAALGATVATAAQLEQRFLAVGKVLDVSRWAFERFKNDMREMAATMAGMPFDKLLRAAEIGASGGIDDPKKLATFSRDVSVGAVALGMEAETVATRSIELAKIFKMPTEDVRNFISAVNLLENKTTAFGSQIFNVTNRFASAAAMAKLFSYEAAALATTMIQGGVSAEVAGTALGKFFDRLQDQGVLQNAAKAVGMQADAFARLKQTDPAEAVLRLAAAYNKLGFGEQTAFMNALGFKDQRYKAAMEKLFSLPDELRKNLGWARSGFIQGNSAENEYGKQMASMMGAWTQTQNRLQLASEAMGLKLMPGAKQLVQAFGEMAEKIRAASGAWAPFMEAASNALAKVASLVRNPAQGFGILKSYMAEIWDNAVPMAMGALDAIGRAVHGLLAGIGAAVAKLFDQTFQFAAVKIEQLGRMMNPLGGGLFGNDEKWLLRGAELGQKETLLRGNLGSGLEAAFKQAWDNAWKGFRPPEWANRGAERAPMWRRIEANEVERQVAETADMFVRWFKFGRMAIEKGAEVAKQHAERGNQKAPPAKGPDDDELNPLVRRVMQLMGGKRGVAGREFRPEVLDPESYWKKIQTGGGESVDVKQLNVQDAIKKAIEESNKEAAERKEILDGIRQELRHAGVLRIK